MPFGLINALAKFHRMINAFFGDTLFVRVYLDDVVIFSRTVEEDMEYLNSVIKRIANDNLRIKLKSIALLLKQSNYWVTSSLFRVQRWASVIQS